MQLYTIILIGIGLSMDAFAVSVCQGLAMKQLQVSKMLACGIYFGVFQAIMPLLGWMLGKQFTQYIEKFDHWIAFGLLVLIGINMIREAVKEKKEEEGGNQEAEEAEKKKSGESLGKSETAVNHKEMLMLAVATSIDALAVGVTFAFLEVNIATSTMLIGSITFALSVLAVWIGYKFGAKNKYIASVAGGIILIVLGIKILLEHLL